MNGKLVPVNDVDNFSRVINDLCSSPDLCKDMGLDGRTLLVETYDWRLLARRIIDVFRSVKVH